MTQHVSAPFRRRAIICSTFSAVCCSCCWCVIDPLQQMHSSAAHKVAQGPELTVTQHSQLRLSAVWHRRHPAHADVQRVNSVACTNDPGFLQLRRQVALFLSRNSTRKAITDRLQSLASSANERRMAGHTNSRMPVRMRTLPDHELAASHDAAR